MISELVYPELKTTQRLNFSGTNFPIWKIKMGFVLEDNGVSYVLTHPKPSDPTEQAKWLKDDFTCRHIILGAMHDDLFLCFEPYPSAKALMDALTARFLSTSMPRRMVLFRKYAEHRMSEDTHITHHIIEMGAMARELEMAGVPVSEDLQAVVLMNSLPESWEPVIGMIAHLDHKEELTLANLSRRLRIAGELKVRDDDAGPSNKKPKKCFKGNCYSCGKPGHCQSDCPEKGLI